MEIRELKQKREEVISIAKRNGGRNVRVFGSLVRGDSGVSSDVDFLIELEPGRSLLDIIAIKQELEEFLGLKVDVVTERAVSPYIRNEILSQAISL